jgi:hypothetical protein
MFILCHAAKNEPRKRAKTFPLGTPFVRAKTVDASRHQCFVVDKQIQILRWRFDIKTPTRKWHATSDSKSFCQLRRTL